MELPAYVSEHLAVIVFFAGATLAVLYPMTLNPDGWAENAGDPLFDGWVVAWDTHALTTAPHDLFKANVFHPLPLPLAYAEHLLGLLPIAGPVFLLTHNALLAANVTLFMGFALGGWTCYLLAKHLGLRRWAALLAASAFAFNLYHLGTCGHLQTAALQWLPLVLLFLDRLLRRPSWGNWLGLALFFNLQLLSCYYVGIYLSLGLACLLLVNAVLRRLRFSRALLWRGLAFGAVTAAINVPLALPYLRVAHLFRAARDVGANQAFAARPYSFVASAPGQWLWGALTAPLREAGALNYEQRLFPGLAIVALAVLALVAYGGQRRLKWTCAALLCVLGILALGPGQPGVFPGRLPYYLLWAYVPGFQALRVPARLMCIMTLPLALLAGLGAQWLVERWPRAHRLIGGLLCVAVLVEAGPLPGRGMVLPMGLDRPAEERWLSQQPPQVIVHLPIPQDDRLAPYVECTRMLYSTYHWHRLVNGYSGFVPDDMVKLTKTVAAFPDRPSLNALRARGVTLIILHRDLYDEAAWQQIARALPAHAQALETVGWFGEALVLRLKPEAGGR